MQTGCNVGTALGMLPERARIGAFWAQHILKDMRLGVCVRERECESCALDCWLPLNI